MKHNPSSTACLVNDQASSELLNESHRSCSNAESMVQADKLRDIENSGISDYLEKAQQYDVVIIGAGPVGLCFAASLARLGLQVALIEKQSEQTLSSPDFDGRDIAVTHTTREILMNLGVWSHLPDDAISEIKQATVLNGTSSSALNFNARDVGVDNLAYIVSNHLIRKAAFDNLKRFTTISLITDVTATQASSNKQAAFLTLSNGIKLKCNLLIAADSRFSSIRQQMGISAKRDDFGKSILVFQMEIEKHHANIAYECFYYGYTMAALPLSGNKCSIVITISPHECDRLMNLNEEQFNTEMEGRFHLRHGKMKLLGHRFSYPLISVYADKFVGNCFALIGDAAVGMHPVTAHGFNFGVKGQFCLANEINNAIKTNHLIGSQYGLIRYEKEHIKLTKPLYLTTNVIAKLFTRDDLKSRCVRSVLLKAANGVSPVKKLIMSTLTEKHIQQKQFSPLRFLLDKVGLL